MGGPRVSDSHRELLPDGVQSWLDDEQKLLSRAVNKARITSPEQNRQARRYRPEAGRTFALRSYWVGEDKATALHGEGLSEGLRDLFVREVDGQKQHRLVVHPESRRFYREVVRGAERAEDLYATPTSSSRTMLVWSPDNPSEPFFAKLSLNRRIGGVVRTIPRSEAARSIGVNDVLHHDEPIDGFAYAREVFSLMPEGMKRGGMIIRAVPDEVLRGEERVIPLFSLYAKPPEGGPPLLARMIEASGVDAQTFLRERIIAPFVRQWFELVVKRGLSHEPHAQNVLLRTEPGELPDGRFLYRDLGGFDIHFDYRDQLQLESRERAPVLGTLESDYHQAETAQHLTNLEVFFVQGFLYNVERALPVWSKNGWLSRPAPAPEALRGEIRAELDSLFRELTGQGFDVGEGLEQLSAFVTRAREHHAAAVAAAAPSA